MSRPRTFGASALLLLSVVVPAACGGKAPLVAGPRPAALPASAPLQRPQTPLVDPVATLLDEVTRHFERGRQELRDGHLSDARQAFDAALDLLLETDERANRDPRVQSATDRLTDQISALELLALSTGDGFAEPLYEPASIDELLSESTEHQLSPAPTARTQATVLADLGAHAHDIEIPFNARVLSYVELFQGRLREWFSESLQRGTKYLGMIQGVLKEQGLPLDLAFVPLVESAFKPNALSHARARGVWQFMSGTGRENGLHQNWFVDERADPEKATLAAAKYFRTLVTMFDGDWHLALASYNAGPGRLQRAIKRSGRKSFWELSSSSRFLPRETREYVPMILAAMIVGRNPSAYGFTIQPDSPLTYERVAVPTAVDLRKVAEWTNASIDDIRSLNPELRRATTPVRAAGYEVKVPVGTAESLRARLAETPNAELASFKWHQVRRGDTLAALAKKYAVRRADLAEANGLSSKSSLRPGTELIIPQGSTTPASRPSWLADASVKPDGPSDADRVVYRVRRGDTLVSIARSHETTVDSIKAWNKLTSSRLMPGDRLTIYTGRTSSAQ